MNKVKGLTARKHFFLLVITFTLLILAGLSYVMAGDEMLLLDVSGAVSLQETAVSRAKRVAINWNVLQNPQNKRIAINLFDGEIITAVHDRTDPSSSSEGFVWVGHVLGENNSSVTLSVVEDVLIGSITLDGLTQYEISSNGQWQELQEIDARRRVDVEGPDSLVPPPLPAQEVNKANLCEDGSHIDLLVAYTPAARDWEGGTAAIEALINLRVADMNSANSNSGLAFSYRLVHVMETDYTETGNVREDIIRLTTVTDPYLADVIAARERHLADLTALIVSQATSGFACGIAYRMTGLSANFADFAFGVTALDYAYPYTCGPLTLAHEFGHNMGNHHDRANADMSPIFPFSYGYQSPSRSFRTIMAYECADEYCPRINLWSNPDVSYAGEATGIDHGLDPDNSADNVRSMELAALTVANFRQVCEATPTPTSTATPAAPLLFDIENHDGDGSYAVAWSAVENADFYQLEENSNQTKWVEIFKGPEYSIDISGMVAGNYCYNVRARIGGGWSAWSGQKCASVTSVTDTPTPTASSTATASSTPTPTSTSTPTATSTADPTVTAAPSATIRPSVQLRVFLPVVGQ